MMMALALPDPTSLGAFMPGTLLRITLLLATGRGEAVGVLAGHAALRALAELGSPAALALVIGATRSNDAELRVRAAQALGSWVR